MLFRSRYSIVEYKRGKPKTDDRDAVQLCAQAICLEEMLGLTLDHGYLYYGQTRHRHRVDFNMTLRGRVKDLSAQMHRWYARGETPPPVKDKRCKNCSLAGLCIPELDKGNKRAEVYLKRVFDEMRNE